MNAAEMLGSMAKVLSMTGMAAALQMHAMGAQFLTIQELAPGASPPESTQAWQRFLAPDGTWRVLDIRTTADTASGSIKLPEGHVRWVGVFPGVNPPPDSGGRGYQIVGNLDAPVPAVEELLSLSGASQSVWTAPAGVDVSEGMEWTGFGVEERATEVPESHSRTWIIQPGTKPAGLYSAALWRLPKWPKTASWKLELALSGRGSLKAGLSADLGQGYKDPKSFKSIQLQSEPVKVTLNVPEEWRRAASLRVTLATAADGEVPEVHVSISHAVWRLDTRAAAEAAPPELGVWDWSTDPAKWESLLPIWKRAGINVVQLALPREISVRCQEVLEDITKAGVQIVAVEGDPHMVLPEAKEGILVRHRLLAGLSETVTQGVQYDVEPYLLPGFRLQPKHWYAQWSGLFEAIHQSAAAPVEAVVPFWLIHQPEGPALLEKLKSSSQRIVVMNYRSASFEAASWGAAWLEWGAIHQHPVALAVECGPVSDVPITTFRSAPEGCLWVAPWEAHGTLAVLFDTPVTSPSETGHIYEETSRSIIPGNRTTLQGESPERVREVLTELNRLAAAMQLPKKQRPRLLLHEPSAGVLEELSATKPW